MVFKGVVNSGNNTNTGGNAGVGAISAGTNSVSSGTVVFSNSNGVSFGLNTNGVLTGSVSPVAGQSAQTLGVYATGNTGGQSSSSTIDARSLSISAVGIITAGLSAGLLLLSASAAAQTNQTLGLYATQNTTQNSSTTLDARSLSVGGYGGVSVGYNAGVLEISGPQTAAQTLQTQNVVVPSAGTQTATSGTVSFANSNGITFGMSGSNQITASVRTDYQSSGAYLTTAALSQDSSKYAGTNAAMTGGSITVNTSGVSINLPAYLTTADLSQNSSRYAGTNGAITNGSITVNTSGVSVNVPVQTAQTLGLYAVSQTTGQSSSSTIDARSLSFAGAGGVSVGMSGGTVIISGASGVIGGGGVAISAGTNSTSTGTAVFSNSNGISFGMDILGKITASYTVPNVPAQTVQTQNVVVPTAGTQTATSGTVAFANSNGISFGMSGSSQITASYTVPSTAGLISAVNVSAGTTSNNMSALTFNNGSGVSFGMNGSVITATVATNYQSQGAYLTTAALSQDSSKYAGTNGAITGGSITVNTSGVSINLPAYLTTADLSQNSSKYAGINGAITNGSITVNTSGVSVNIPVQTNQTEGWYALGNTTAQSSSGTVDARSISISGAGAISVGLSAGQFIISGPNVAAGNVTFSAGGNSAGLASLVFSNSNGVSFGLNGSTITASVNAGGGAAFSAGISNLGNTSGTSGTVSGQLVLVGTNGMGLSQSADGTNATVSIENLPMKRLIYPDAQLGSISGPGVGSMSIQHLPLYNNLSVSRADIMVSQTAANALTTYLYSYTLQMGLYTNNNGTLSILSSGSLASTYGWTWTSGNYSSLTGLMLYSCPLTANMTPGDYFMMVNLSTDGAQSFGAGTTRSSVMTMTVYGGNQIGSQNGFRDFPSLTNTSLNLYSGMGMYSVTSNAIPSTIAVSGVNAGTGVQRANIAIQLRG